MTREKALRIHHLRVERRGSLRWLSEQICDEFPDEPQYLRGNQLHGKYNLCWEAMMVLSDVTDMKDVPQDVRDAWDC
jgi:hypothetical protein